MARYIDVESFIKWLEETISFYGNPNPIHQPISHGITMSLNKVLFMIKSIPTADVVEVVRCEECENATKAKNIYICNKDWHKCKGTGCKHNGGHYCSYGKRKEKKK